MVDFRAKLNVSLRRLLFLAVGVSFSAFGSNVQAEERVSQACPDQFNIVDLGKWTADAAGNPKREYGGTLLDIGVQDKTQPADLNGWVSCYPHTLTDGAVQQKGEIPVPLVSHVVFPDGKGLAQYASQSEVEEGLSVMYANWAGRAVSETELEVLSQGDIKLKCFRRAKLGDRAKGQKIACLQASSQKNGPELLVTCASYPVRCGYSFAAGRGLMIYQQETDMPANMSLRGIVDYWHALALRDRVSIHGRIVPRDASVRLGAP